MREEFQGFDTCFDRVHQGYAAFRILFACDPFREYDQCRFKGAGKVSSSR